MAELAPGHLRHRRRTTVIIAAASILEKCDEQILPAMYSWVGAAFNASPAELGNLVLARAVVQALASPLGGLSSSVAPRGLAIAAGCVLWAIFTALFGTVSSIGAGLPLLAFNGLGLALVIPNVQSLVADYYPPSARGRAFGALWLVISLGGTVGSLYATNLGDANVAGLPGWRFVFFSVAVVSAIVGVVNALGVHDPAWHSPEDDRRGSGGARGTPGAPRALPGARLLASLWRRRRSKASLSDAGGGQDGDVGRDRETTALASAESAEDGGGGPQPGDDGSGSPPWRSPGDSSGKASGREGKSGDASDPAAGLGAPPDPTSPPGEAAVAGGPRDSLAGEPQGASEGGSEGGRLRIAPPPRAGTRGHGGPPPPGSAASPAPGSATRRLFGVLKIPTFGLIIGQGIVGSVPYASLIFLTLYFQLLGMANSQAAFLVATYLAFGGVGGLLGGAVGDLSSRLSPNHGRVLATQFSVGLGVPFAFFIFKTLHAVAARESLEFGRLVAVATGSVGGGGAAAAGAAASPGLAPSLAAAPGLPPSLVAWYALTLALFATLTSWAGPCANNPIFAEIVPPEQRNIVYAFDRCFEGAIAAGAAPAVGALAQRWFGFDGASTVTGDRARDLANATAVGSSLLWFLAVPWTLCLVIYTGLHWTYPRDRRAAARLAAANALAVEMSPSPIAGAETPTSAERVALLGAHREAIPRV